MASGENQHRVVDFFSADSNSGGEILEKEPTDFLQPLKPPPPVSLSLRTRKSSALVCKHIFDKIFSSAESYLSNTNEKSNGLREIEKPSSDFQAYKQDTSNAALQGDRNIMNTQNWQVNSFSEEHGTRVSETETSFSTRQPQAFCAHDLVLTPAVPLPSKTGHNPVQTTSLSQIVSRPSLANTLVKPPSAQLTIFYSGNMNVYDDVPADRANAIMLLAGTGNVLHLNQSTQSNKEPTPATLKGPSLPIAPPLQAVPASKVMKLASTVSPASPSIGKGTGYGTLTTNISAPSTALRSASPSSEPKPQAGIKRPYVGIELPQPRKASLARFLEKRKDRVVQVKQLQVEATPQNEGKVERNNDGSPSSSKTLLDRIVITSSQAIVK